MRALTTRTMLKLIDCLVKPVAMYSCQIWLPFSHIMKETTEPNCYNIPQCLREYTSEDAEMGAWCTPENNQQLLLWGLGTLVDYLGQSRSNPSACVISSGCLRPLQDPTVPTNLSLMLSKGRKTWGFDLRSCLVKNHILI